MKLRDILSVVLFSLLVMFSAGCSNGSSGGNERDPAPQPQPNPGNNVDAFIDATRNILEQTAEDTEPVDVSTIIITVPEDSEPVEVDV